MDQHPDLCYVYLHTTDTVGVVKWGESGYYQTDYHGYKESMVEDLNRKLGLNPVEVRAMVFCSMRKMQKEDWPSAYQDILKCLQKH